MKVQTYSFYQMMCLMNGWKEDDYQLVNGCVVLLTVNDDKRYIG